MVNFNYKFLVPFGPVRKSIDFSRLSILAATKQL